MSDEPKMTYGRLNVSDVEPFLPMPMLSEYTELSGVVDDSGGGLVVRPGDIAIVEADASITNEQAALIREHVLARLPDLRDVVVLGGCRIRAVYRPDEEAT